METDRASSATSWFRAGLWSVSLSPGRPYPGQLMQGAETGTVWSLRPVFFLPLLFL